MPRCASSCLGLLFPKILESNVATAVLHSSVLEPKFGSPLKAISLEQLCALCHQ